MAAPSRGRPLTVAGLGLRAGFGGVLGWGVSLMTMASLEAMRAARTGKGFRPFDQLGPFLQPSTLGQWTTSVGLILVGLFIGLGVAAALAARRGMAGAEATAD